MFAVSPLNGILNSCLTSVTLFHAKWNKMTHWKCRKLKLGQKLPSIKVWVCVDWACFQFVYVLCQLLEVLLLKQLFKLYYKFNFFLLKVFRILKIVQWEDVTLHILHNPIYSLSLKQNPHSCLNMYETFATQSAVTTF